VTDTAEVMQLSNNRLWLSIDSDIKPILGQSIAISGCCLTVAHWDKQGICFDLNPETRKKTYFKTLQKGDQLNLEYPLSVGAALDGHMVTGHVDTTGHIIDSHEEGQSVHWRVGFDEVFSKWVIAKGSITIDGISLTINEAEPGEISLCLIPHTFEHTNAKFKKAKDPVNIEFDMMAKFFEKQCKPYMQALESRSI